MDPFRYIISNLSNFGQDIGSVMGGIGNLAGSGNSGIFSIVTIWGQLLMFSIFPINFSWNEILSKIIGTLITILYILKGIEVVIPSMLLTPPGENIMDS